ncbi:sterol desaturase family protein [Aurantiacibacter flavus]|uniref:Sterol desaturase family protein n=1 Tax=Aurantiacibacter flavus TaxID=3145232 RepID=A0ABV0CZ26_9SPHN
MPTPDDNPNRLVLFENQALEKLTVISVRWFALVWSVLLPLIALAGWGYVSALEGLALVGLGLLLWTLFEYFAHRHLFHWDTSWKLAQQLVFVIHGNHHEQPRDLLRNLMPPIISVPVGLLVWALLFALIGHAGTWVLLGFMGGYVLYDITHYACHQWPMRSGLGRMLKRHHMRHHFNDEAGNFSITALFWDRVFGTHVDRVGRKKVANAEPLRAGDASE